MVHTGDLSVDGADVEADLADSAELLIASGANINASQRGWGTPLEAAERTGHNELAAMLRRAGARSSGRSVGDTICVRPWQGDGYCAVVEEVNKTSFRLRVTEIIGCENGCQPKAECSASRAVGTQAGATWSQCGPLGDRADPAGRFLRRSVCQPEHRGGLEIDDQLVLGWRLHRQVSRLLTL